MFGERRKTCDRKNTVPTVKHDGWGVLCCGDGGRKEERKCEDFERKPEAVSTKLGLTSPEALK